MAKDTFWQWFDRRVAEAMATDDGKAFADAGMHVTHTGGGFMGWEFRIGEKQVLVTDDDGTGLFTTPETTCWNVGLYDDAGECVAMREDIPTVAEAIALAITYRDEVSK
jgi:hypothetical protein